MIVGRRAVLGGAVALAAAGRARGGAQPAHSAAIQREIAGPWDEAHAIRTVGGVLRYATLGKAAGEPLVLLPKLGGWIADWRKAAPVLAQESRVIAFDPPGHGLSIMDGPPPYLVSVPEIAAMLLAALDEMGVERFAVAGNSLGGVVGIVMAACWPERISKLVIVSASLIGAMTAKAIRAQDAAPRTAASPVAYGTDGRPLPQTDMQTRLFGTLDPSVTQEQNLSRVAAGAWMRPCERGVGRVGVTDYLPRIRAPTLLINADHGRYTKYAEVGMRLIPDARSLIIPGAGAFVHQEKPQEVASAINRFLA